MGLYLVHGQYTSRLSRHPGAISIRAAWQAVLDAARTAAAEPLVYDLGDQTPFERLGAWGSWVSPLPRIVRLGGELSPAGRETHVAGLWRIPDTTPAPAALEIVSRLREITNRKMLALEGETQLSEGDWSGTEITAYNEAVNGPLAFWQGPHAVTQTADAFPSGVSPSSNENPLGPTSGATRPGSLPGLDPTDWTALARAATWLVGIGLGGVLLVQLAPVARDALRSRPRTPAPAANPRPRRRRR